MILWDLPSAYVKITMDLPNMVRFQRDKRLPQGNKSDAHNLITVWVSWWAEPFETNSWFSQQTHNRWD